ncbi:hypothetical protein ACN6TW_10460 [Acinetobacter radioresistens]|uniref:Uncharacterized protein n=2 Tax=Acinetobacter TaxID=469 RepID=A0ABP2GMQ2_ACIRA|nr:MULTISPECIES: hypothetical protein [Acinetobacter]EET83037.1 hypothetical protein ACIRA0001_3108 [Acinetobacter radioresistens SK82]EEY87411.1 hypothetical protein HMPREF0018_00158 [Acinetobacter radioresistens SH164]EXE56647.1 hypothetical protein J579_2375 [Acinetobacter sp. 1239920]MCK4095783.1 hypothetical protein [Acinetobacter radioresistens]MCK4099966.1 hypothetical protein [Acinetobacter radioresistens]
MSEILQKIFSSLIIAFENPKRILVYRLLILGLLALLILNLMFFFLQEKLNFIDYMKESLPFYFFLPILMILFFEIKIQTAIPNKNLSDIDAESENRVINIVNNNGDITIGGKNENSFTTQKSIVGFSEYFISVINYLEIKAIDSDKKASLLLDNGKRFSVVGIIFFILATIIWQFFITSVGEFKTQHIYGILSTSLVFIFIEFISAWYLRQYKSFSDTSTYLTKIKSIFDKYMLIYLVSAEKGDKDFTILLEQLSSDIKWPETYLLKNADVSFAKDALETMTTMAQAFKNEVKNKES